MLTAITISFVALALLLPLATGIYAYKRTGLRSFLQIPFATVFVPIALAAVAISWFAWSDDGLPRWVFRLPQLLTIGLVIDAVRRLERQLS